MFNLTQNNKLTYKKEISIKIKYKNELKDEIF
jgi:hypothetical protein